MIRLGTPVFLAVILVATPASADTIKKTDGTTIDEARIESETLSEVTYKDGTRSKSIPSAEVLSIKYERMPDLVDEALTSFDEGDWALAESLLDAYVDGVLAGDDERRFKWAPAFAAWKATEIQVAFGDMAGTVKAADRLISNFDDSRFLPQAYLAKANAQAALGEPGDAKKTLDILAGLVTSASLSRRWELETKLAQVQVDPDLALDARRDELGVIQSIAGGEFPSVRARARLAEGESWIAEATTEKDTARRMELVANGRSLFGDILAEFKAEPDTLAGAHAGVGDCLFLEAASKGNDAALLKQALHQYLRVIVVYKSVGRYQPRCLYQAGFSFKLMGTDEDIERARKLFRRVMSDYPNSEWAGKAKLAL